MLSVKAMIAGAVQLPTIVFDEIDTGVSGEIADHMADIMHEMGAANRQVISITHLPQIAARGAAHYKGVQRRQRYRNQQPHPPAHCRGAGRRTGTHAERRHPDGGSAQQRTSFDSNCNPLKQEKNG